MSGSGPTTLKARRLGLISQDEAIALIRADSHVSRAEGLSPRSRVLVCAGDRQIALERLLVERSLSVNTAAAGGNASLMSLED